MSLTVDVRVSLESEDCTSALKLLSDPSNSDSLNKESMELVSELFRTFLSSLQSSTDIASNLRASICIKCLEVTIDSAKPREMFLALLAEADRFLPTTALNVLLKLFARCITRLETTFHNSVSTLKADSKGQAHNFQKNLLIIEQLCQSLPAHIHSLRIPSPSLLESAREALLDTLSLTPPLTSSDPALTVSLSTLGAILDFVRDSLLPLYSRLSRAFPGDPSIERFRFEIARLLLSALDRPLKFLQLLPLRAPLAITQSPPLASANSKLNANRSGVKFTCDCCSPSAQQHQSHPHCVRSANSSSPHVCQLRDSASNSQSENASTEKALAEKEAGGVDVAKQTADCACDLLRALYPNAQALLELALEHNERERIRRTRAAERSRKTRENLPQLRPGASAVKGSGEPSTQTAGGASEPQGAAEEEDDEYVDRSVSVGGLACLSYLLHGEADSSRQSMATASSSASPPVPEVLHPRFLLEFNLALAIALLEAGPVPTASSSTGGSESSAEKEKEKAVGKGAGKSKGKAKGEMSKSGADADAGAGAGAGASDKEKSTPASSKSSGSPKKKVEPQIGVVLQHHVALKGLLLLASRLPAVADESLNADALETGDYKAIIALLFHTMVFNELKSSRTLALQVFTALYSKFGSDGRYRLILHVFETFNEVAVKAHAVSLLKNEIAANWRLPAPLPLFLADGLERMYDHIFRLPHGSSTDVMSAKEALLAGVNLLRYLVLIDSPAEDRTGVWRALERRVERECVETLREAISVQRHQYELALERVAEQARDRQRQRREQSASESGSGKEKTKGAGVDLIETGLDIRVGPMTLPPMPARQTADVIHGAIAALDLVHSVLARTTELIAQRRAEAKSVSSNPGQS